MVGEVSRLFFFSGLSGTTKNKPNSVLDDHRELQYLTRKIGTGNTWIINALKKISLFDNNDSATDAKVLNSPMDLIKTHWIEDQYRYFNKALKRDEAKLNTLNWIGSILFLISFLSGLCLFSLNYLDHSLPQIVKPVLSALIGISAGLGGILRSFSFTMGYSEITGQYRMMSDLFEDALLRMNNEHSNKNAVFEQLWWEALMENVEWFSLKNSRLINTFDLKKSLEGLIRLSKI